MRESTSVIFVSMRSLGFDACVSGEVALALPAPPSKRPSKGGPEHLVPVSFDAPNFDRDKEFDFAGSVVNTTCSCPDAQEDGQALEVADTSGW